MKSRRFSEWLFLCAGMLACAASWPGTVFAQPLSVIGQQEISDTAGNFLGVLKNSDELGTAVAGIGDLDGDGTADLVLGAPRDDDGSSDRGAVWVMFLNPDGTVKASQKISDGTGGFPVNGESGSAAFGSSITAIGDIDDDGIVDIAVGARDNKDGGNDRGAVWIIRLLANGTVKSTTKISSTSGGFTGTLDNDDEFGASVAALGDLDGDGVVDLAVGAPFDEGLFGDAGALWILFLNANGTVKSHKKITGDSGVLGSLLADDDLFGETVAAVGDLDGDDVMDVAVGAPGNDDGGGERGAVWILFLNANGTAKGAQKISSTSGGFGAGLDDDDFFGQGLGALGDLEGDGKIDLAVGAPGDDDGGNERGAAYVLRLAANGTVSSKVKVSDTAGAFGGVLADDDSFGESIALLGDINGDGASDLAIGAPLSDDGGGERGAAWIVFLETCGDGSVGAGEQCDDGNAQSGDCCSGTCQFEASGSVCDDGLFCNGADKCGAAGTCSVHTGNPCAGGGECADTCSEAGDTCNLSAVTACSSDGNGCTDDFCDGAGACAHTTNSGACDDGLFCNGADTCSDGSCSLHAGDPCSGGGECADTCSEAGDTCNEPNSTACSDDGNLCTDDLCDGAGACAHVANSAPCDDGLFCNGVDTCGGAACSIHEGNPCVGPDGDADCVESCDETLDACSAPDPDDSACDDAVFCNGPDSCSGGVCAIHSGDPCSGGSVCGNVCDEPAGNCGVVDGSPCDDGLFCTGVDACDNGACSQHSGDPCTGADGDADCAESCDEAADLCNAADPDGSACDDAVFCNGADTCGGGVCSTHVGDPCPGADGDSNCSEQCDETTDACTAADPDGSACEDLLYCNGADTCNAGACVVHAGDPCVGGPQCADACNETSDTCATAAATACDDDLYCTQTDECDGAGACVGAGNPCGETGACTETCNETEDVCRGCGQPFSSEQCLPNAVITLRTAVGLAACEPCICDVDGNGGVFATDAQIILRACVGLGDVGTQCPGTPDSTSTTSTTVSGSTTTSTVAPGP